MNWDDYRAHPALNFSVLKHMADSPAHCRAAEEQDRAATTSQRAGSATHCMTLEPEAFPPRYSVWTGGVRRGKEWDAFQAANPDKTIITLSEYETCVGMAKAVRSHPAAASILSMGEAEKSIFWTDPETGLGLKGRIDWLCGSVVDLKTTQSTQPRRFASSVVRYQYHRQLAFYRWGVECSLGFTDMPCHIIAVESTPPFDVAVYTLDEIDLGLALDEVREMLRAYAECKASGRWPGRFQGETTLKLPAWAFETDDDAASELGLTFGA